MQKILEKIRNLPDDHIAIIEKRFISISAGCLFIGTLFFIFNFLIKSLPISGRTDFRPFYMSGLMLLYGHSDKLYSLQTQYYWQHQIVPQLPNQSWLLAFLNPPFVALLFVPFALVPYHTAFLLWGICNICMLTFICMGTFFFFKSSKWQLRYFVIGMVLTFLPTWVVFAQGQISFILALSLLFGWFLLRSNKLFWGGFIISFLIVKPQYILLPALVLAWKKPHAFLGFVSGVLLLSVISIGSLGIRGIINYGRLLFSVGSWGEKYGIHPQIENTWGGLLYSYMHIHNIGNIFLLWIVGCGVALLLLFISFYNNKKAVQLFDLQWAMLIVTMLFVSPHSNAQDLLILIIPGCIVANYFKYHNQKKNIAEKLFFFLPCIGYIVVLLDDFLIRLHVYIHLDVYLLVLTMVLLVYITKRNKDLSLVA